MSADDHDHDNHHSHDAAAHRDPARPDLDDTLTYYRAMETALRELMIAKGVFTADDVRRQVEDMDNRSPVQGARVVAKAWVDPEYRKLLLRRRRRGLRRRRPRPRTLQAGRRREHSRHAQRDRLHAMLLLPALALGAASGLVQEPRLPIARGARAARRSYATSEPRSPTTSPCACMIPPPTCAISCCRSAPAGTDGWGEERLAELVSRDAMIGVSLPRRP